MKILAMSDIHADWDRFAADGLPDADAALVAGDLTEQGTRDPREIAAAGRWLASLGARYPAVYWIPGNHDIGVKAETFGALPQVACVLDRCLTLPGRGLTLRGVSCCPAYNQPELSEIFDYTTTDPAAEAAAYDFGKADIVLSHCPPYGVLDLWPPPGNAPPVHIGSEAFAARVRHQPPMLIICVHVHEAAGHACCGSTEVYNVARACRVIEI